MSKVSSPSELISFLEDIGASPQKRLSQNFLIDGNILEKIVKTGVITSGDLVLEIGPGPGALTQKLLEKGATVVAIEKDPLLASHLLRLQTPDQRLTCCNRDILDVSLEKLLQERLKVGQRAKVVANLPYHLTTPILTKLIPLHSVIESLTIMVQKEVAERITATKGSKHYSSLNLFLRFYAQPSFGFTVPPTCFYPKPSVNSAVITLRLQRPHHVSSTEQFFQLTRTAFHQRRKMLKVSLRNIYSSKRVEQALSALGLDLKTRPEQLSIDEFIALFETLYSSS